MPSAILMAIAYQESGWRQFDASGNTVIGSNATSQDIGIMQINSSGRTDIDRLMTDIDYNIETGARILDGKWKLAPGIGDRDRNVLENWYYAIWAYNGLSSTNNPNTPGGRHYQDRVLALMARQVLGSDGQPLWPPVAVTLPSPSIIANPPAWIPTPQPVHYGDLYGGFNQGDNFRVLESPAGAVLSTTAQATVGFLVQNVGTTTWDATYQPILTVGDPVVTTLQGLALAQPVLPGGTVALTFTFPSALPAGALSMSLAMRKNGVALWRGVAVPGDHRRHLGDRGRPRQRRPGHRARRAHPGFQHSAHDRHARLRTARHAGQPRRQLNTGCKALWDAGGHSVHDDSRRADRRSPVLRRRNGCRRTAARPVPADRDLHRRVVGRRWCCRA